MADVTSPLIPAANNRINLPGMVAPATLAEAAQMSPMQAMLAQYGLSIPTAEQIPQHFMFSDQAAPAGFPQTAQYGAGFGAAHPALATRIENALLGAQMAPGGMPTAGQNIAQVAGSLTGVPQWRLQRRIGMTLAPLEIAGAMQNIQSQQAQAQGQLLSGMGMHERGIGYMGVSQADMVRAQAEANRVSSLYDMWNKDPKQAQAFMKANQDMVEQGRLSNPLYYVWTTQGPKAAQELADIMAKAHPLGAAGHLSATQILMDAFMSGDQKRINAAMMAGKYLGPFIKAQADAGLLNWYGQNYDPFTHQQNPGAQPGGANLPGVPGPFGQFTNPGVIPPGVQIPGVRTPMIGQEPTPQQEINPNYLPEPNF